MVAKSLIQSYYIYSNILDCFHHLRQNSAQKTYKNKAFIPLLIAVDFLPRYDYENVNIDAACEMMEDLEIMIGDKSFVKQRFAVEDKIYQVEKADNFEYTDPVDSAITRNQVHDTHWAVFL